ncbi:MAG: glycoside hydrolase family 31 protein, partial [Akkermansiaceae bacterium]
LGDKSCINNLRGKRFELWGSDTYAYGRNTDPLYKNIPFFIGHHHGQAYGIFFDNTHRTFFDFGKERKDVCSFWAQGGHLNYYFIAGPTVADVIGRFAQLTGTPELPPLWSLGYHQCKWSYKTEKEYRDLAKGFTKHQIPCDALYLDIDYMDGFRCFTWNKESFPNPPEMIKDIHEQGFKTVAMIDPGIKVDPDYDVYQQGIEGDHFCRQMDGDVYTGKVWPGAVHFPDYTKASVREWWGGLYQDMVENDGVHGFWNDMNEPADFNPKKTFPRHIRHDYDGHPCSHRRAHNIYGTQMVKATRDGIAKHNGGKRPFVITRSAYAGAWRYSSAWTGDNISNWEHLRIANIQCQRLNISGYSFVGSDIGGFLEQTNGELYTRWIQLGIFHPFCRTHSSGEHGDQEPWSFGEPYTSIVRKFIELRYRLLSYIYTTFYQHTQTGAPMLRPLIYLDDEDPESFNRVAEFGLGDHLLTCPITEAGAEGRWLYLPRGDWYNFWDDASVKGGEETYCEAPLELTPLYVKAGALLPLDPVKQNSWEESDAPQEWHLYAPSADAPPVSSQIYTDSGDHYGYQDGDFHLATFTSLKSPEGNIILNCTEQGKRERKRARLHLHGLANEPTRITIDDEEVTSALIIDLPASFQKIEVTP